MADRYTYVPMVGLFIMVAWGIPELLKKCRYRKEILVTLSIMSIACCFIVTWIQVGYWRDNITLSEHALKVTDNNYVAYNNRGVVYYRRGIYKQAIMDHNRAIEIKPTFAFSYMNRGNAYSALGNQKQAIEDYKEQ